MWIWCTVHTVTTPGCSAAVLRAAADRVLPGNGGELSGNMTKGVSKISQNTLEKLHSSYLRKSNTISVGDRI